jgi:hypothetical protein
MLGKVIAGSAFISMVLLVVLLQTTTPSTIGPLGILLVFILMYTSALGVLTFLFFGTSRLIKHLSIPLIKTSHLEALTLVRSYYFCSIIALAPVMLLAMQSVGEISIYDVSLVTIFVILGCLYISKRTLK